MKVYLHGDERYPVFDIRDDPKFYYEPYEIEIDEAAYKNFLVVSSAWENWQDKLDDAYKAARQKKTLENAKNNGVPSKGFG